MVERKFKNWQLAFIVGLIFIIPVIIVFQYTSADIVITFDEQNGCEGSEPFVCTFFSNPDAMIIILVESDVKWTLSGTCITTDGELFSKGISEFPEISFSPPADFEQCRDMISFDKDMWNRQFSVIVNTSGSNVEVNKFTLVNPQILNPQMNIIGG